MKVSIFDVAKKSGLSVVTVSRVLNGAETVREKNRQKVLDAIKELGYHPNAAARSLARGKTGIIGLIVTTLQDSFFDAVVKELNEVFALHGYYLAISVSTGIGSDGSHYLIQEDRVDGLILLSPMEEDNYIVELKKRGIPYVLIDNQKPENDNFSVTIDNFKGGYAAASHLLDTGYTSIAHLCGQEMFRSTRERRDGFMQALSERGLTPFEIVNGGFEIRFGYKTAVRWLKEGRLPQAVFAGDDNIALGVVNALTEAGVQVPGQVAVVGYDDQTISSQLHPYLTTVRQPADRIGIAAADMLLKRIDGTMKRGANLKIDPELIVRESSVPGHRA
ncbi:LacI family transcriptional regulator/LacI family purine nucleotide synthesis repressor [Paenibacillus rhizosphaerae]|uniref:LacI family transcriptional regulator/LacI family purine nucleotide synthesis repressor n=1 Tax=Paenibacillus rhizosphaerae TaxID=297318 RepID=A0A839TZA9_9BACL|nr:LacI family DNA-binding transcriptional regulator [Paenibacillus rhizosphaerae]MBB3129987.1 LacI family transcriptional regulator/LacI family purine nucleotide synthesis repressor [Paenibacillus rhizosphaerae]